MKSLAVGVSVFALFFLQQIAVSRSSEPRTSGGVDEDPAAIAKLVAGLFDEQNTAAYAKLEKIGKPAVPALVTALNDPRTASVKFESRGFHPGGYSPFERITSLLEPFPPADAVRPLENYLQHQDSDFRKTAARALGNIGTVDCIPPMLRALEDPDDSVRTYAMFGIDQGMTANRCTPEFLDAMFPALAKILNRGENALSVTAPSLMLRINPDKARSILLSPENFNAENEHLQEIIEALNKAGQKVPHNLLLTLLTTIKPLADDYPHDRIYGAALIAYAHHPDAATERTLRTEMSSANERIQEAAAEALTILAGVSQARQFVFDAEKRRGFNNLTTAQQHYFSVALYDAEVNNGGHSQYCFNSSGDHWKVALAGLRAIGAPSRAAILQDAAALFGTDGPAVDTDTRRNQLIALTEQQQKSMSALDDRYYMNTENIEALLAEFAISNREHFGGKR